MLRSVESAGPDNSSSAGRGVSARSRGISGVARRTASGARGGDALVMRGRSSADPASNSGSFASTGVGAGARRGFGVGCRIDEREIIECGRRRLA